MLGRRILVDSRGEPRLFVPGIIGVVVAFVVALSLVTFLSRPRTDEQKADALLRSGRAAKAEQLYAALLKKEPSVPLALGLLDAHDQARLFEKLSKLKEEESRGGSMGLPPADPPMSEDDLDALLGSLPEDISVIARFSRGFAFGAVPPDIREKIDEGAGREPPLPWANHLLGREATHAMKPAEAAIFYEREGINFRERHEDLDVALEIWMKLDSWDVVRTKLADPRVAAAAGAHAKYRLAVHDNDWRSAVRYLPAVWAPNLGGTGLALSGIAALGWAFFLARLGKAGARPRFRIPLYAVAFALGIASVFPTVFLIAIEEAKLHLVESGDPLRDFLFFVFGVGLREEAAKLLLFLPLLPILRKYGDKLDVLVCGAFIGLGFAAEENLGYLANENLHTGLGRFLTANFFHMALTGTLASALDDFVSDRERYAADFSRTSLFIVAIHGAYDFLLSHDEFGGSYFAMTAFIFLTRMFLGAVETARRRADRGIAPVQAFVLAAAIVTGVTLAFATLVVGPKAALLVTASGLLGEVVIIYVFVRTLRAL